MKEQNVKDGTGKKKKNFFFILPLVFCLLTLVTGCVQYDVGVNFESQTRGEIVQHIKTRGKVDELQQRNSWRMVEKRRAPGEVAGRKN
jgi:hypothetical protein